MNGTTNARGNAPFAREWVVYDQHDRTFRVLHPGQNQYATWLSLAYELTTWAYANDLKRFLERYREDGRIIIVHESEARAIVAANKARRALEGT